MAKGDRISTLTFRELAVTVTRKPIRNLHLRIKPPSGDIFISAPYAASDSQLVAFLEKSLPWIERHRAACIRSEAPLPLCDGAVLLLFGERITLQEANVKSYSFDGSRLLCNLDSPSQIRRQLTAFYTDRMKETAEPLLARWCEKTDLCEVVLRFREMTSRFGSCHPQKRIVTLNLRLALCDPCCLEYVLVHELVHFYHPDHSPAFYAALSRYLPDWRKRKHALLSFMRQYSLPDPFSK